jgi:hypothetical protein
MTQKTPAQLRATAEAALIPLGKKRRRLIEQLAEIDQEMRPLIVEAVRMEVPYRRIRDLTAISPNTAAAWKRADSADGPQTA